ncbi:MAG TPA: thioredoxin family protein [Polyangiales bacterium]
MQLWMLPMLVVSVALTGCDAAAPKNPASSHTSGQANEPTPAPPTAAGKPRLVVGAVPVAAFVAEQQLASPGRKTVVYVGASWCEPCQRFHRALEKGELDAALQGVRFIDYDYDQSKAALEADGYSSRLIPLFALPAADGRSSGHSIEGSIKGEGAVDNIVPRLRALLTTP